MNPTNTNHYNHNNQNNNNNRINHFKPRFNSNYNQNNQNNKYNQQNIKQIYNKYNNQQPTLINNNEVNNQNTDDIVNKGLIIDYLYNKIEVGDYRYVIIKNASDIFEIKNKRYYVSGNTCGINAFLIFIKINNDYHSYLIDRRSISYSRESLNVSKVRFIKVKIDVNPKLYEGTIIDGIIIDNTKLDNIDDSVDKNSINFMCTDLLLMNGKSYININYKDKLYELKNVIKNYNNEKNNIKLYINTPYEINEIDMLCQYYIKDNIKKYNIKGICFNPEFSGTKIIYLFDKTDDEYKNNLYQGKKSELNNDNNYNDEYKNNDNLEKRRIYKFEKKNLETTETIFKNLEMVKTNISDVYKLFAIFSFNQNNNQIFVKRRIGTAYIPTYNLSLKLKNMFILTDKIIMKCQLSENKLKWIPIDQADINKIDVINTDDKLKIIESFEIIDDIEPSLDD